MTNTHLNADTLAQIVALRRQGTKVTTICKLLRMHRNTYNLWMSKGKELFDSLTADSFKEEALSADQELYLNFYLDSEQASAEFETEILTGIKKSKAWQAKAWLLERNNSEDWLKNSEKKIQIEDVTKAQEKADKLSTIFSAFVSAKGAGKGADK